MCTFLKNTLPPLNRQGAKQYFSAYIGSVYTFNNLAVYLPALHKALVEEDASPGGIAANIFIGLLSLAFLHSNTRSYYKVTREYSDNFLPDHETATAKLLPASLPNKASGEEAPETSHIKSKKKCTARKVTAWGGAMLKGAASLISGFVVVSTIGLEWAIVATIISFLPCVISQLALLSREAAPDEPENFVQPLDKNQKCTIKAPAKEYTGFGYAINNVALYATSVITAIAPISSPESLPDENPWEMAKQIVVVLLATCLWWSTWRSYAKITDEYLANSSCAKKAQRDEDATSAEAVVNNANEMSRTTKAASFGGTVMKALTSCLSFYAVLTVSGPVAAIVCTALFAPACTLSQIAFLSQENKKPEKPDSSNYAAVENGTNGDADHQVSKANSLRFCC